MFSGRATIAGFLLWGALAPASPETDYLKTLDVPVPACEGSVSLDVAREYFVPIANPLPGRESYNELVKLYRAKDWSALDAKTQTFHSEFPDSPLQEAASFLSVEARFERLASPDESATLSAEKAFRKALLTHPSSSLAPPVVAGVASYWLLAHKYDRSLALYREALSKYAGSELECVFESGAAEAVFHLRDWKEAEAGFNRVLDKCSNPRLRVAARLRLGDLHWAQSRPAQADYERAIEENVAVLERYYPFGLYNLAEIHYRAHRMPQAKLYYDRYLKLAPKTAPCLPFAAKRVADIALQMGERWQTIAGMYLAAYERAPSGDVGRYSRARGLLIGFPSLPPAERARRVQLIDADLGSDNGAVQEPYRSFVFLEKGLALLDSGDRLAMGYLERLEPHSPVSLKQGPVGDFIRDRYLRQLERLAFSPTPIAEGKSLPTQSDSEVLSALESGFPKWWKGTAFEARARRDAALFCLKRFDEAVSHADGEAALDRLAHWVDSSFWPADGPSPEDRRRVNDGLVRLLVNPGSDGLAVSLLKHDKTLRLLVGDDAPWVWLLVSLRTQDAARLKASLARLAAPPKRSLASVESQLPEKLRGAAWLEAAKAWIAAKEYRTAEKALDRIHDKGLRDGVLAARFKLDRDSGNYAGAFDVALEQLRRKKAGEREAELTALSRLAWDGKLWKRGKSVWRLSRAEKLSGKAEAPFELLRGRSAYELAQWDEAVAGLEAAIKLDPAAGGAAEARFLLGKSLVKKRRRAQAEQVWNDLIKLKDPFWSPLAQNELKLLP